MTIGEVMTPKEIETAIKDGNVTAAVREDSDWMSLVLRPRNSSRVFQMIVRIEEVSEL